MTIENLTHPGVAPVDGDLIRITHSNGAKEEKQYWAEVPFTPVSVVTPWTRKDFILKFTPVEYAAIKAATLVDSGVDYYWAIFQAAENVMKTDPVTIAGINALEAGGLIGPGRAAEILA